MKNAMTFNEGTLVRAYDDSQYLFELAQDQLKDALVNDTTAGDGTIVSRPLGALNFGDQGDGCGIPFVRKKPRIKELLHCPDHIMANHRPRSFVEPAIETINAWCFILRDAPHSPSDILPLRKRAITSIAGPPCEQGHGYNVHIYATPVLDIIAQYVRVELLENLFNPSLITRDLISYMQHIYGVCPLPVCDRLVEELSIFIPHSEPLNLRLLTNSRVPLFLGLF